MRQVKHRPIPHLVHIETTYACNSNCKFCYNPGRYGKINYSQIDRIVRSIARSRIPHVYLIGGEPSLLKVEKLNEYIDLLSEHSSVTIVTNGRIYLKGLSKKLACLGVPLHGEEKTHDYLTRMKGSRAKTIENIKKYVNDGFDVRCIPVLMSVNYDQIYSVIRLAKELGMESVFVDRFESGGLGSKEFAELFPKAEHFRIALGQMIKARDDFNMSVGFGTAIPFCIDKRLVEENMQADCGVGTTFCAVNPDGGVRICNQSSIVYGNVLNEPIEKIWNKKEINKQYRSLEWVTEPCNKCDLLYDCVCGCKVDLNCSPGFCVDYAVRGQKKPINKVELKVKPLRITFPKGYRTFAKNRYLKLNNFYREHYIVTRYQTVEIDRTTEKVVKAILDGETSEQNLVKRFRRAMTEKQMRNVLSKFELIGAIDIKK